MLKNPNTLMDFLHGLAELTTQTPVSQLKKSTAKLFLNVLETAELIQKQVTNRKEFDTFLEKCAGPRSLKLQKQLETLQTDIQDWNIRIEKSKETKRKRQLRKPSEPHLPPIHVNIQIAGATVEPGKPKAVRKSRGTIPKSIREAIWYRYVGRDRTEATCRICRSERIKIMSFHAGHVISDAAGGSTTVENLRPICARCNLQMGTMNMKEYCQKWYGRDIDE